MKTKSLIAQFCGVVLLVIYVMSLGGINVHTCSHTGDSYVTFLFEGVSCQAIHPSHSHEHGTCCSCCDHHEAEEHSCDGEDDCCSNESHLLLLTGDSDHSVGQKHLTADSVDIIVPTATVIEISVEESVEIAEAISDTSWPPLDVLSTFCILRV